MERSSPALLRIGPSILLCLTFSLVRPQTDSLFMSNGDILVGELKEMVRSVAILSTDYSDADLRLDWDKVRMVRSSSQYMVQFTDGERMTARLYSVDSATVLLRAAGDTSQSTLPDIVYLKSVEQDLWSRASAGIDLGYNFTKANNLQQFSVRSFLGYQTDRWMANATYNRVTSRQDEIADIERQDLGIGFRWSLPAGFFVGLDGSFLANTEQRLTLRSSVQPSVGNFLIRNNSLYLLVLGGAAYTHEDFSTEDPDRNSTEGLMGVELNMFDVGDITLFLSSKAYPSFTESGRWRMDHRFDVKYDLPMDLYVRAGITLNYDNRPVVAGAETDYVLQTALGWEL